MARRILHEQGGGNTANVRTAVATNHDFQAGQGLQMEDLILAEAACRITLPKHPYKAQIIQIVADHFHGDGHVHVHGGEFPINGGDRHLKASSTVTLTFTGGEDGEWVPSNERGPRGHRGEEGPKGAKGATGIQGPTGSTGAQGIQGSTGPSGILQRKFERRTTSLLVPAFTSTLATDAPLVITTSPGSTLEFVVSFSFNGGFPVDANVVFEIREGALFPGANIASPPVAAIATALRSAAFPNLGSNASGSIVFSGIFPAGVHNFFLVVNSDTPITIDPVSHAGNASLYVQEMAP